MSQTFDVPDALQKCANTVSVDELARRGLRTVKVLNRSTVLRLIDEAVERVVAERLNQISDVDHQQIRSEARSEFTRLVKERKSEQLEQQKNYEDRIESLRNQAVTLEGQLHEARSCPAPATPGIDADQLRSVVKAAVEDAGVGSKESAGEEIEGIRQSIDNLAQRVGTSTQGGGSSKINEAPSEEALVALFSKQTGEKLENNLDQVEVKNAKAGGVAASLAKLRGLQ
ncbi:MAG: hypothetical protein OSB09_11815, partial [Planctomycetota bacterium]|nr:hypothetical protein [Planctomycetota bacterium]